MALIRVTGGVRTQGGLVATTPVSPIYTLIEPELAAAPGVWGTGSGSWTNIANLIKNVNDDTNYAQLSGLNRNTVSESVDLTKFQMEILGSEVIDTVSIEYKMVGQNMGGSSRTEISLLYSGSAVGSQKNASIGTGTHTVGGDATYWGTSLTPAILNDITFGVGIKFHNITGDNDNRYARIAYAKLTVTYV